MSITGIVMLVLTILFFAVAVIIAAFGALHGFKKSLLSLCRIALSAVLSYIVVFFMCMIIPVRAVFDLFLTVFNGSKGLLVSLTGLLPFENITDIAASAFDKIAELVNTLLGADSLIVLIGTVLYSLFMPMLFVALFIIFSLILMIPCFFIGRAMGITKKKPKKAKGQKTEKEKISVPSRLGSVGIQFVTALFVMFILVIPISGIVCTVSDSIMTITEAAEKEEIEIAVSVPNVELFGHRITDEEGVVNAGQTNALITDIIGPIRHNIIIEATNSAPVRIAVGIMVGSQNLSDGSHNEITQFVEVAADALAFAKAPETYGENQIKAMDGLVDYISSSDQHSTIVSDVIVMIADDIKDDNKILFGLVDLTEFSQGDIAVVYEPAIQVLADTTPDSVKKDFESFGELIKIAIEKKLISAAKETVETGSIDALANVLSEEDTIYSIIRCLDSNDNLRKLLSPSMNFIGTTVIHTIDPEMEKFEIAKERTEALSEDELHHEAKIYSDVFKDAAAAINEIPKLSAEGDVKNTVSNMDIGVIGRLADNARKSIIVGDGIDELIVKFLESEKFDKIREVADIVETHIDKDTDKELNLESILVHFQRTLRAARNVNFADIREGKETDNDPEDYEEIIASINDAFAEHGKNRELIKEVLSSKIIKDAVSGGDKEYDPATDPALTEEEKQAKIEDWNKKCENSDKLFDVMINVLDDERLTDDQVKKEASALDVAVMIIRAGNDSDVLLEIFTSSEELEGAIGETGDNKEKAKGAISVITNSKIVSAALIELAYEVKPKDDVENGYKGIYEPEYADMTEKLSTEHKEGIKNAFLNTYNEIVDGYQKELTEAVASGDQQAIEEMRQKLEDEQNQLDESVITMAKIYDVNIDKAMLEEYLNSH